jgi:hypothetical protein
LVTCEGLEIKAGFKYSKGNSVNQGRKAGLVLSSPPLRLNKMFWLRQNRLALRACNPIQYFVHSFLDSGIRLVKLTGSLGGKLTEHITVP